MRTTIYAIAFALAASTCWAAEPDAAARKADGADDHGGTSKVVEQVVTYKEVGDRKLQYWLYRPSVTGSDPVPAILFFHGGGWSGGSHKQFEPHAKHLAAKGLVVASAEYRLTKRDKCQAVECTADTWDAYRHFLSKANDFGFDAKKLAVGGGSAGGHLAACLGTGTYPPGAEKTDDVRPVTMFLFNPAVCLAPYSGPGADSTYTPIGFEKGALEKRVGCEPKELSPLHHVDAKTPPAVIFHGDADTTVGIRSVELFCDALKAHGTKAILHSYPGRKHAFFNEGRKHEGTEDYPDTLVKLEAALEEMRWLPTNKKLRQ